MATRFLSLLYYYSCAMQKSQIYPDHFCVEQHVNTGILIFQMSLIESP